MFKRIRKQSKESVGVSLGRLIEGAARGIGGLLDFVAGLEKEGKSEYRECGEIKGKTDSGKDIKGVYGFGVKIGLNPEDFRGQKRLSAKGAMPAGRQGSVSGGKSGQGPRF